ncbi:MAG: 4Fe-4S binding protein [Anaerolineales bacterium]|nr:4Fe-4S binding protein [Anaerolineales bacterium]
MEKSVYKNLAERLDALPNGFPPAENGAELRLLAKIFTPEEAELASQLRLTKELPEQVANRLGRVTAEVRALLKGMARKGLIAAGRTEAGLGYGLMPFVVGIYEMQVGNLDEEMAALFEEYYKQAFTEVLRVKPQVHRVIPVNESIKVDMEVRPFESASDLVNSAKAWGVLDCICRKQKALIGDPCEHPLDVCMTLSDVPEAFNGNPTVRALTREEALGTLKRAAEAGLVHSVSNNQKGIHYICNCCTCSCGVLRGMAEVGIANVVAHSSYVNQVDELLCNGCETCLDYCQFDALAMGDDAVVQVNAVRCVGCGVCVLQCPNQALGMVMRPDEDRLLPPETIKEWGVKRAADRGINLANVM